MQVRLLCAGDEVRDELSISYHLQESDPIAVGLKVENFYTSFHRFITFLLTDLLIEFFLLFLLILSFQLSPNVRMFSLQMFLHGRTAEVPLGAIFLPSRHLNSTPVFLAYHCRVIILNFGEIPPEDTPVGHPLVLFNLLPLNTQCPCLLQAVGRLIAFCSLQDAVPNRKVPRPRQCADPRKSQTARLLQPMLPNPQEKLERQLVKVTLNVKVGH